MRFSSQQEAVAWAKQTTRKIVLYSGAVLDVSHFAALHPGGQTVFKPFYNRDITKAYNDPMRHTHDELSFKLLASLEVGRTDNGPLLRGAQFLSEREPLMAQVRQMDESSYLALLKTPHYFSESVRLFDLSFFEMFSKTEWKELFLVYPIMLSLLLRAVLLAGNPEDYVSYAVSFLFSSVVVWVLTEYVLHQFLFHSERLGLCRHEVFRVLHFCMHGIHHVIPFDANRIIFPPIMGVPILLLILKGLGLLLTHPYHYLSVMGIIVGYLCYDLWHYSMHSVKSDTFASHLRYHNRHHFATQDGNYGVTTGFLDQVFSTKIVYPEH